MLTALGSCTETPDVCQVYFCILCCSIVSTCAEESQRCSAVAVDSFGLSLFINIQNSEVKIQLLKPTPVCILLLVWRDEETFTHLSPWTPCFIIHLWVHWSWNHTVHTGLSKNEKTKQKTDNDKKRNCSFNTTEQTLYVDVTKSSRASRRAGKCALAAGVMGEEKQEDPLPGLFMHYQRAAPQQTSTTTYQGVELLYRQGQVRFFNIGQLSTPSISPHGCNPL